MYLREVGEREKRKLAGTMGRGGNKERHPPFPLPIISRTLSFFNFFFWIPARAYLTKRGTSECFAPGVPPYKREKDAFVKISMYVWLVKFVFYAGKRHQFMTTRFSKLAVKKINMD